MLVSLFRPFGGLLFSFVSFQCLAAKSLLPTFSGWVGRRDTMLAWFRRIIPLRYRCATALGSSRPCEIEKTRVDFLCSTVNNFPTVVGCGDD